MVQNKGMEKNALVSYLTSIFRSPAWDADHFIIYGFVLFSLALFAWWVIGNLRHSLCSDCLAIGNTGDSGKRAGDKYFRSQRTGATGHVREEQDSSFGMR